VQTYVLLNSTTEAEFRFSGILILIDSLTPLAVLSTQPTSTLNLTAYLSSLLAPPQQRPQTQISLVAVYHTDIPISTSTTPYTPSPLSLLSYLATTIITVHSLATLLAEKAAREKSLPSPVFGLAEEIEGVIIGLKPNAKHIKPEDQGIAIELEHRRKSGRGVLEWYFLPALVKNQASTPQAFRETVTLLDDHPLFKRQKEDEQSSEQELAGMTFELGLTDRQRQEREGVVLPYFDAQKAGGGGEGGRILYDMGVEDDFDDEEDEI
jgi:elongator complex protein 5